MRVHLGDRTLCQRRLLALLRVLCSLHDEGRIGGTAPALWSEEGAAVMPQIRQDAVARCARLSDL
jgi:hypothetical protein